MKYAVIAALLATSTSAAVTGCKKGIGAKVYQDSKCKDKAHAEHTLVSSDVEKLGACNSESASDTEKKAVVTAQKTLDTKETAAKEAKKKFERTDCDILEKTGANPKHIAPNEYYSFYKQMKEAYVKKIESAKPIAKYNKENPNSVTDVNNYKAAYKAWYEKSLENNDTPAKKAALETLKTASDTAAGKVPSNFNKEQLQQNVKDEVTFQKFLDKVDDTLVGTATKTDQDKVKDFLELDKANDDAIAAVKDQADVLQSAKDLVDAKTYASLVTCDAKAGIVVKTWDGDKCEGTPEHEFKAKWGECTQWGGEYYKITGAATLQAAAIAVVAFAGSQF